MKRVKILMVICVLMGMHSCHLFKDNCEDTEAPEINFGMKAGGTVKFTSWEGADITDQFEGKILTITFYKDHCNGAISGPFEHTYSIDKYGELWHNEIGYWSFKMNNTQDRMRTRFYYLGKSLSSSPVYYDYDDMKPYDGSIAVHKYMINISLNSDNTTVHDAYVDRLN
jgi:hypothetical protein